MSRVLALHSQLHMVTPAGQAELLASITSLSYSQLKTLCYTDKIVQQVRLLCEGKLGSSPCLWQLRVAFALLKGNKDVICVARTGAGKSLTFYIPLLVRMEGIIIVVVPLNALASDMASRLTAMGLPAISVTASTSNEKSYIVSKLYWQCI